MSDDSGPATPWASTAIGAAGLATIQGRRLVIPITKVAALTQLGHLTSSVSTDVTGSRGIAGSTDVTGSRGVTGRRGIAGSSSVTDVPSLAGLGLAVRGATVGPRRSGRPSRGRRGSLNVAGIRLTAGRRLGQPG